MHSKIRPSYIAAAPLLFVALITLAGTATVRTLANEASDKWRDPYVGEWSNGRGDTLVITSNSIKFGNDKPVPYHDVTKVTNGREFNLQITTDARLNYLTEFLHISFGDGEKTDQMKMTLYNSRKDMEDGENSQGEATWDRDK
jgi:hypothetical protein